MDWDTVKWCTGIIVCHGKYVAWSNVRGCGCGYWVDYQILHINDGVTLASWWSVPRDSVHRSEDIQWDNKLTVYSVIKSSKPDYHPETGERGKGGNEGHPSEKADPCDLLRRVKLVQFFLKKRPKSGGIQRLFTRIRGRNCQLLHNASIFPDFLGHLRRPCP